MPHCQRVFYKKSGLPGPVVSFFQAEGNGEVSTRVKEGMKTRSRTGLIIGEISFSNGAFNPGSTLGYISVLYFAKTRLKRSCMADQAFSSACWLYSSAAILNFLLNSSACLLV